MSALQDEIKRAIAAELGPTVERIERLLTTIRNERSDDKPVLSREEVADILNVNPRTVSNWVRDGKIESTRGPGGRQMLIPRTEVERLLKPSD